MNGLTSIYALTDPGFVPDALHTRYVGKTRGRISKRLWTHIKRSSGLSIHVACWIKGLASRGEKPDIHLLSNVPQGIENEAEREAIYYYRSIGANLTNLTDGGDGCQGLSEEVRGRISMALKGKKFTEDHCRNISRAQTGKRRSEEARRNIGAGLKKSFSSPLMRDKFRQIALSRPPMSQSIKDKISETLKERHRKLSVQ